MRHSESGFADLERPSDLLTEVAPVEARETVGLIEEAVTLPARHPLLGRPVEYELRELVIPRGRTAYVALYSLEQAQDAVLILAIRHQREAGYSASETG